MSLRSASANWFMLFAFGLAACSGDETVDELVYPPAAAKIVSFGVNPAAVDAGATVTVSWTTQGSKEVALSANGAPVDTVGADAAEGSAQVQIAEPTVFVLVATGEDGKAVTESRSVRVEASPLPSIDTFAAEPAKVDAGNTTVLRWRTRNASSVRVVDEGGVALDLGDATPGEGSVTTPVLDTTAVFRLVASRGDFEAFQTVTVRVEPKPDETVRILSFGADRAEVEEGGKARVSWSTSNADLVRIFEGLEELELGGQAVAAGAVDVFPRGTTSYRLVASKGASIAEKNLQLQVTGYPTAALTVSDSPIDLGGMVSLSWTTDGAERVQIEDTAGVPLEGGPVEATGTRLVHPAVTTTYALTAEGPTGKKTVAPAIVEVRPQVLSFAQVKDAPAGEGDLVELAWKTAAATAVEISNLEGASKSFAGVEAAEGRAILPMGAEGQFQIVARSGRLETVVEIGHNMTTRPAIGRFEASSDVVSLVDGAARVRLTWSGVHRADSVELIDSNLGSIDLGSRSPIADSIELEVHADTTFTLTARNASGEATAGVLVRAVPSPAVTSVMAWPEYVAPGESVDLTWGTTGAAEVAITANGFAIPGPHAASGTISVPVHFATMFEVKAINEALDSARGSATVAVGGPQVTTFTASSTHAWTGSAITFEWETRGASSLTLSSPSGVVHTTSSRAQVLDGSFTTAPLANGDYDFVLSIASPSGATRTSTVRVRVGSGPSIESFTVTPSQMLAGSLAVARWTVGRDPDGALPTLVLGANLGGSYPPVAGATGSVTFPLVQPGAYDFILTATTAAPGSVPAVGHGAVTVYGTPAVTLTANPGMFDDEIHTSLALSWTSANADTSLTLYQLDGSNPPILLDSVAQADRSSGTFSPTPPAAKTTYRIVATNALGMTAISETTVIMPPPQVLTFGATPVETYPAPTAPPTVAVLSGDAVDLTWTAKRAATVKLDVRGEYLVEAAQDPYEDITGMPGVTTLTISDPDVGSAIVTFPAGFTFDYFDVPYTSARVFVDGFISFDTNASNIGSNYALPYPTYKQVHLAPFWENLHLRTGSLLAGPVGNDFVFQWTGVSAFYGSSTPAGNNYDLNFQVVLHPDGTFEYRYGAMTPPPNVSTGCLPTDCVGEANGSSATIGYQNAAATSGHTVHFGGTNSATSTNVPFPSGLANKGFHFSRQGQPSLSGTFRWTPQASNTMVTRNATLSLTGDGTDSRTIGVVVHPKATVNTFAGPAVDPSRSQPFALTWTSSNATAVKIYDPSGNEVCSVTGTEAASGSCNVVATVSGLNLFTVIATGALGTTAQRTATVNVASADFGIGSFQASAAEVNYGSDVTLSWETGDADQLAITANGIPLALPPGIDFNDDSFLVTNLTEKTTFVLTITGPTGATRSASQVVTVRTFDFTFTATETEVRPGQPVTLTWTGTSLIPGEDVGFSMPMGMQEVTGTKTFEDITATAGPAVIAAGASASSPSWVTKTLPTGFTFPFFGVEQNKVVIGHQGLISFDSTITSWMYAPTDLPQASDVEKKKIAMAPFWGDLQTGTTSVAGAGIFAQLVTDPVEGDRYIIQYNHMRMWNGSATDDMNFQVVLYPDGSFEYRFGSMASTTATNAQGGSKTVGYQTPNGAQGFPIHFGSTASTTFPGGFANRSWRYSPPQGNGSLTIQPGSTGTYKLCGSLGGFTECKEITITADFKLSSFLSSVDKIDPGETVDLSWVSVNGDTLQLKAGTTVIATEADVSIDAGTLQVSPLVPTTYTLEVHNAFLNRTLTATKTITVRQFSLDLSIQRSGGGTLDLNAPIEVLPGELLSFNWDTTLLGSGAPAVATPMWETSGPGTSFADLDISADPAADTIFVGGKDNEIATWPLPSGFAFPYMGTDRTSVQVGVNGFLSFDSTIGTTGQSSNFALPSSSYKVHIAPFWDDLFTRTNGRVFGKLADADTYVIQWHKMSAAGSSNTNEYDLNFQVVLHADGSFEYRYGTMAPPPATSSSCFPNTCVNEAKGSSATIAYQDPTGQIGQLLHFGGTSGAAANPTFALGLQNRSFRYQSGAQGSGLVSVSSSGNYTTCALMNGYKECKTFRIVVPVPGDLLITELMLDPAGGAGQWFEVRNLTGLPVNLEGWEIETEVGTHPIGQPVVVPAYGYATFSTTGTPGFTPTYVMSGLSSLGAAGSGTGHVSVKAGTVAIATLSWDSSWSFPTGGSLELDVAKQARVAVLSNPASFCPVATSYDGGAHTGTPGAHGMGCNASLDYQVDFFSNRPVIDISAVGQAITGLTAYLTQGSATLSFPFPFFGSTYTAISVSSNGFAAMVPSITTSYPANAALPSTAAPSSFGIIAPFWNEASYSRHTGNFRIAEVMVAGQKVAVLQWNNLGPWLGSVSKTTFQAQLWETGDIVFAYLDLSGDTTYARGSTATVGIQEPGTSAPRAIQFSYNQPVLQTGRVIEFIRR